MFICVAGKNNIAVDVLEYLIRINNGRYELGVVCNKTETGKNSWQKSLRFFSQRFNVPEYHLEDMYMRDDLIFISLEFDKIVNPDLFKDARLYNIHFSLLPSYKGMYTSAIPILNGEEMVGVTFHEIDKGIDTGNIIAQKKIKIDQQDTSRDLYSKYISNGTQLVLSQIENVIQDKVHAYPQEAKGSTYYSKKYIDYSNIKIDLRQTALGIQKQIRAFSFREYQLPVVCVKKIIDSKITDIRSLKKAGTIVEQNENGIMFASVDYNIILYIDRFYELLEACKTGDLDLVKDICSVKKHINECDEHGWTPLMVATYNNQKKVVDYLLINGADIFAVNNNGTNLLMYAKAAYLQYNDIELLKKFFDLGVDIEREDYRGKNLESYLKDDGYKLDELLNKM